MNRINNFLKKKNVIISTNRYLITALSYMTYGLFGTLIIGSILNQIGVKFHIQFLTDVIWPAAKMMTGSAIAVGIAYGLEAPPIVIFSSSITGFVGASLGGPVGAFIAGIFGAEFGKLVSKETKIDILVTPSVTIIVGSLIGKSVGSYIGSFMSSLGDLIITATKLHTLPMSIIVSVLMGIALTLPISSAAISIMLGLSGLAGGAATAGCSAQMIGFAVMSYKENGMSGFLSQGIGTSMLQMPNIIKNHKIWIPPIIASMITAPIATMIFHLENTPIGSGMGTSGFVGQFGTLEAMHNQPTVYIYIAILIVHFILPALISLTISLFLRKIGWIKDGDLKLDL